MSQSNHVIILIRLLSDENEMIFTSELQTNLEKRYGQSHTVFSLDNFSDGITTNYTLKLLEESQNVVILCEPKMDASLGSALSILNKSIQFKHKVKLLTTGETKALKPFMKFLNGNVIEDVEDPALELE